VELQFPLLAKKISVTTDPDHFRAIDLASETAVPLPNHPGAFGVTRTFHVHEGVDLYCVHDEPVVAMEAGRVVAIIPFTGTHAGSPWWLDTFAVLVEGVHGVLNYGEIAPDPSLRIDSLVTPGEQLGRVIPVLRRDKGRPRSMLHLERYEHGTRDVVEWRVGAEKPAQLRDPTELLVRASEARS
jgi:hypothetical protein